MVLYLTNYGSEFAKLLTDMEREVRCLALMVLFNLSVVHKNRHRLLRHKVLEKLQTVLQVSASHFAASVKTSPTDFAFEAKDLTADMSCCCSGTGPGRATGDDNIDALDHA